MVRKKKKQEVEIPTTKGFVVAPMLSKEQDMLQEMFSGNDNWGTGQNLPRRDGILITGKGLIKNDDYGETASMFGGFR